MSTGDIQMSDRIKAWQCIGCGRIDSPQNCIGICQDRRVDFVYASEHDETLAELEAMRARLNDVEGFVRRLARTTPRKDEWERSYRRFQDDARRILANVHDVSTASAPAAQPTAVLD
jgi:hypothetical protein